MLGVGAGGGGGGDGGDGGIFISSWRTCSSFVSFTTGCVGASFFAGSFFLVGRKTKVSGSSKTSYTSTHCRFFFVFPAEFFDLSLYITENSAGFVHFSFF